MKNLANCLAYVGNLLVACVWAYALVWGIHNDYSWSFLAWSVIMILLVLENVGLRSKVNKLERD